MKRVFFTVMVLTMLTSCIEGVKFHFTGETTLEENRELSGFERIEQYGSLDVEYMQADSFSVRVNAPDNVLDQVETRVEGNKLIIRMNNTGNIVDFNSTDGVTVYVTSPDFLGVMLKGSGNFECKHLLDTDNLDIELRGSGDVEFDNVICDHIGVALVGSGDVEVKKVKTLQSMVELIGSGDIKMKFEDSGRVEARLMGSGDIALSGQVQSLREDVRGSGDLETSRLIVKE